MNFLQLVQRLKSESGRSGAPLAALAAAAGDDLRLIAWVASAWTELQQYADWAWMRKSVTKPLTIGQERYTTTDLAITDFSKWAAEDDDYQPTVFTAAAPDNVQPLSFVPTNRMRRAFILQSPSSGAPQYWSRDLDDSLLIGPAPVEAYSINIDYWSLPTALALDADTPAMPARYHEVLVWRALMDVAGFDAAPEVHARAQTNYNQMHGMLLRDQGPVMTLQGRKIG